jgi:putative membrane protein
MFSMHNLGWGGWLVMSVGMVALWALLIFGVVALARRGFGPRDHESRVQAPSEPAVDILERRLASGELSIEEYEERRAALRPGQGYRGRP